MLYPYLPKAHLSHLHFAYFGVSKAGWSAVSWDVRYIPYALSWQSGLQGPGITSALVQQCLDLDGGYSID